MGVLEIVFGIALIVMAVFLIVAILLQDKQTSGLSGAIGGGSADTYYGKNKGSAKGKKLSTATTVVAIVFAVAVLAAYLFI